jgi:hypothetical protein
MKKQQQCNIFRLVFSIGILFILSACGKPTVESTPTATTEPTIAATATQTALPGHLVLWTDPNTSSLMSDTLQTTLSELATQSGSILDVVSDLPATSIQTQTQMVVSLHEPANLTELMAANPATRWVVFTGSGSTLAPSSNLSILRMDSNALVFAAGYAGMVVSDDWHLSGMLAGNDQSDIDREWAFDYGARYWCGNCSPVYPPVFYFPITARVERSADLATMQSTADVLLTNYLPQLFYVDAPLMNSEFITYLAGKGKILIGGQIPSADQQPYFAAAFDWDAIEVDRIVRDTFTGTGLGQSYILPLQVQVYNPEVFTTGRLDLIEQVMNDLHDDLIIPFLP